MDFPSASQFDVWNRMVKSGATGDSLAQAYADTIQDVLENVGNERVTAFIQAPAVNPSAPSNIYIEC
ncbi:uncharacterized protein N7477_007976 [Penicillium maclennaniae]|uniref:uncharacterized protein n=1 Tax=Penicillium maclennaniae TaxID=1343394 RepID=UPI0025409917|nr:uncharacterized protein N7477_007976 [Penicillium maclennaniae]KAJ5665528.1 hypothetical protein N7477_007976 [Penicillium maclennaniae]